MSFLQEYLVCFEYVRAIVALAGIRNEHLAPLELDAMEEQCRLYNKLMREQAFAKIAELDECCDLLYYDGECTVRQCTIYVARCSILSTFTLLCILGITKHT